MKNEKIVVSEKIEYIYHTHNEHGEIKGFHKALDNIDIAITKGEFIAILGHNGSGKSTLAKQLNALLFTKE